MGCGQSSPVTNITAEGSETDNVVSGDLKVNGNGNHVTGGKDMYSSLNSFNIHTNTKIQGILNNVSMLFHKI